MRCGRWYAWRSARVAGERTSVCACVRARVEYVLIEYSRCA